MVVLYIAVDPRKCDKTDPDLCVFVENSVKPFIYLDLSEFMELGESYSSAVGICSMFGCYF